MDATASLEQVWTLPTHRMNSHPSALVLKSAWSHTTNPKTVIVVANPRIIMIAVSRTAIPRIIDPGTAPLSMPVRF
ncbi:MAG: hypothetical protein SFW36_14870 [Leptolyngbyaceae cyanobacterium bins.59]|nr:hypothetical protein [Leptolyngbyaceae cyanobacterium bins.59]